MSWNVYIERLLINRYEGNHTFKDVCSNGMVIGCDGQVWGAKRSFALGKEELQKIGSSFKEKKNEAVNINGNKGICLEHDEIDGIKIVLYKSRVGGFVIGKTNKAYVIGEFENSKMMEKDGEKIPQNIDDVSLSVVEIAKNLINSSF